MSSDIDLIAEDEDNGHSIFSPSGSAGWIFCADYLNANRGLPDTAGEDAAYGTVCHSLAEEWLRSGRKPNHRLGTTETAEAGGTVYAFPIDDEMMGYVSDCMEWVEGQKGELFVETKVDFSDLTPIPDQKGTCDAAWCRPKHLTVRDWKFGKGVQVFCCASDYDPDEPRSFEKLNTQAIIYGYGFFRAHDERYHFETISIGIGQPRLEHWHEVTITRQQLLDAAAWIKERAHAAWGPNKPRSPSPKACQWCKAKPTCTAVAIEMERLYMGRFGDLSTVVPQVDMDLYEGGLHEDADDSRLPNIGRMPTDALAHALTFRKMMEGWFEKAADELLARGIAGEAIPDKKVVEGRSHRQWIHPDPEEVEAQLRKLGLRWTDILKVDLVSPSQAAERLKAVTGWSKKKCDEAIAALAYKPAGRPTLAPLTDKRPQISTGDDLMARFAPDDDDL